MSHATKGEFQNYWELDRRDRPGGDYRCHDPWNSGSVAERGGTISLRSGTAKHRESTIAGWEQPIARGTGKPAIKGNRKSVKGEDYSSEAERRQAKPHEKRGKNERIRIDREEIIAYPPEHLPGDAEFKGYAEVLIQDLKVTTDNVLFRKERYYSPSAGKTYVAELPCGYEGAFGPGLKALVFSLYYEGNLTQGKLLAFLADVGISISAGYLAQLLIKNLGEFSQEQDAVYAAGLASSPWQHFDQTGARVGGVNYTTNVVCNPWYTIYWTTPKKDRLSVLASLQNRSDLQFISHSSL
jgi:hypothetical protein